jgi:hypothetical protein
MEDCPVSQGYLQKASRETRRTSEEGGRAKKTDLVFPVCMLLGAKTLSDRMIVINWWCNLTAEQQAEQKEQLSKSFKRPTVSASPQCLRVSAAGAKEAEERGILPRAVSLFDNDTLKASFVDASRSANILSNRGKHRASNDAPVTYRQVHDRSTRRRVDTFQKALSSLYAVTEPPKDATGNAQSCNIAVVIQSTKGDHKMTTVYARNEDELSSLLGSRKLEKFHDSSSTELWFHDSGEKMPATKQSRTLSIESDTTRVTASTAEDAEEEGLYDWDNA